MTKSNDKKNFFWNILGTGIYSCTSLLFLIIVTRINGLDVAGYFSYGFIIANIMYIVINYGGRNYQITDINNKFNVNTYVSFRIVSSIIVIIFSFLFFSFFNYDSDKYLIIILLIIAKSIESVSDVYYAIMQKNNKLSLVGKSLFYKSICAILIFLIIDIISKNIFFAILGYIIIDFLFLDFFDIYKSQKIQKSKIVLKTNYIDILKSCFSYFIITFISFFMINIPRYVMDFNLTNQYQAIFGIVIMPVSAIYLLVTFLIQPFMVNLSKYYKYNILKFKASLKKIIIITLISSILLIGISYIIGIPALNLIYNINLNDQKINLILVLVGGMFYALTIILSTAMIIMRKSKVLIFDYLATSIISIIISIYLINQHGFNGSIYSYTITMIISFVLFLLSYCKIIKQKN